MLALKFPLEKRGRALCSSNVDIWYPLRSLCAISRAHVALLVRFFVFLHLPAPISSLFKYGMAIVENRHG